MTVEIERFDLGYAECCGATLGRGRSMPNYDRMLWARHSPIRCIMFRIEMVVPSFVSTHFVRHKIGVEHFVQSMRNDKTDVAADRYTPVRHVMILNAEALMNMAAKRLCAKAHARTRDTMTDIVEAVQKVDPTLAKYLVPPCKDGGCREMEPCNE